MTDLRFILYVNGILLAMLAGAMIVPALVDFAGLTVLSYALLVLAMLLGRLELTTVYVLFIAEFWRG